MKLTGMEIAVGESVSEWLLNEKARILMCTTVAFINTVHLGYTKFIKKIFFFLQ
jgi:hypothetical protein